MTLREFFMLDALMGWGEDDQLLAQIREYEAAYQIKLGEAVALDDYGRVAPTRLWRQEGGKA